MKKATFTPQNPNGVYEDLTPEEATQRDADIVNSTAERQAYADKITQYETDKASAVSKLEALGLTSAEIDSLTK
jgi:hypothetical protein